MTAATIAPAPRKSLEPILFDWIKFFDYQIEGVRWLARQRNFLLADQMGLGKSLQTLTTFAIDIKLGLGDTLIVVCPVTLRGNWDDEVKKFTSIQVMRLGEEPHPIKPDKFKTLPPAARSKQIEEFKSWAGPKVLVCNYEQVKPHCAELRSLRPRMVVFDEAHYCKSPTSQRTVACHALAKASQRVALLTGTPVLNRVDELWSLLHMLDPVRWPSYRRFINRYCVFGGFEGRQIVGAKNTNELNKELANVMLRRLKKDVLTLPEPTIRQIAVDLHPTQQKLYDELSDNLVLPGADGKLQDIENALTKFLRLKQICGTAATIPEQPDDSYKLDRAVEIIKELLDNGEKVVVFTQFREVQQCLVDRLIKAKVKIPGVLNGSIPQADRVPLVREWSAHPEAMPLVCMIQVAGVGLNMTAARTALFIDKLFTPGLNQQAIDRIHRIGQQGTQPVEVIELIARNTIEHRIEQILKGKAKLFDNVVEEANAFRKLLDAIRASGGV